MRHPEIIDLSEEDFSNGPEIIEIVSDNDDPVQNTSVSSIGSSNNNSHKRTHAPSSPVIVLSESFASTPKKYTSHESPIPIDSPTKVVPSSEDIAIVTKKTKRRLASLEDGPKSTQDIIVKNNVNSKRRLVSSPEAPPSHSEAISSKYDPIEDSSFSFSQSQRPATSTKALSDMINWLSESEEESFAESYLKRKNSSKVDYARSTQDIIKESEEIDEIVPEPLKKTWISRPTIDDIDDPFSDANKNLHEKPSAPTKAPSTTKKPKVVLFKNPYTSYAYSAKELKEANRITRKKQELLSEMVIHIPEMLKFDEDVMKQVFDCPVIRPYKCNLPLIFWKRKVKALYDSDRDIFIPCTPTEIQEKTLVLYYKAAIFMIKIENHSLKADIDAALRVAESINPDLKYSIIVVVEGYDQYIMKLKNAENKKYKDEVLKRLNEVPASQSKKKKTTEEFSITHRQAEFLVNKAQIELKVNIFPIRGAKEVLDWLHSFTYTIAFALYDKYERNESLANLGVVRSGTDKKSTFLQSVRQFKMMTEPKADKLYGSYQTMWDIYSTLKLKGTLGKDGNGKNIVPPTTDSAMKRAFLASNPQEVIND